jgi:dTDP-4-amino-4,6-dideoxygalactose transaminase
MPAPIAALGLNQFRKIDRYNAQRRDTARRWDNWCNDRGYQKPRVLEGSVPVFLRYPVLVEPERKRDRAWAVRELGLEAGVWFVSHLHPSKRRVEGCPNADQAVARCINFPCLGVPS